MARDAVDQYMPFFGRDFLASTAMWSADEVGHYIRLLIIQWDHGHLPDDIDRLERVSPGVSSVWEMLRKKFPLCADNLRRNTRMEEHRQKALELKESRSAAGKRGAANRWKAKQTDGKANGPANGKAIDLPLANGMAKEWPPNPNPNPNPSPKPNKSTPTPMPIRAPAQEQQKSSSSSDFASDDPRECWEAFRARWKAQKRAAPLGTLENAIDPPRAYLDLWRGGDSQAALDALGQLSECRYFEKPLSLSQFLNVWPKIAVGGYREPRGSGKKPEDKPAPERWLDKYQPSDYKRPREAMARDLATTLTLKEG